MSGQLAPGKVEIAREDERVMITIACLDLYAAMAFFDRATADLRKGRVEIVLTSETAEDGDGAKR